MLLPTIIISLIILLITFLSFLPAFIFEKQKKETKKKFKLTRIYSYLLLIPVILIYGSLIFDFKNFSEHGGWALIAWFFYSPIALLGYCVPMFFDEILHFILRKLKERSKKTD